MLSRRPLLALGAAVIAATCAGALFAVPAGASQIPVAPKNAMLAHEVPASLRSKTLTVAMDATYAPDEYIQNGKIVGMDADLAKAISQVLGLKIKLQDATFATIIPGMLSGRYDIGMSSFTDTRAREKQVSFVDYFSAGEAFYVLHSSKIVVNGLAGLCGHTVGVESGTTEQSDANNQAKKCKVTVDPYGTQSEANVAVSSGRAQIGFADSQVAAYIVAQSHGVFKLSGKAIEVAPYGIALPKKTGLVTPVLGAVNALIHDGIYLKILQKWGIAPGAITKAVVNGATS
ncbi:MAG: ABC transporter substrate-binding protein [Acidimicrobiales bacterium]